MAFTLNYPLIEGDKILVELPGFTHASNISSLASILPLFGSYNSSITALWIPSNETLELTCSKYIQSGSVIGVILDGAAGLRLPLWGISSYLNTPRYFIQAAALSTVPMYYFPPGFDVGVSQAVAYFIPFVDGSVNTSFSFLFPEYLSVGDSIVIHLDGFKTNQSSYYATNNLKTPFLSIYWNETTASLNITVVNITTSRNQYINLMGFEPLYYPHGGVSSDSLSFSLSSATNGNFSSAPFTNVTLICGFENVSAFYTSNIPGGQSSISLGFALGGAALSPGDKISFLFGGYGAPSSTSMNTTSFQIIFDKGNLTLYLISAIQTSKYYSMNISSELGLMVPSSGISRSDRVYGFIDSKNCQMVAAESFPYSSLITDVQNASLYISTSPVAIGDSVNITFGFNYSRDFVAGDIIELGIPYLSRNIYLLHEVNITSVLPISATYDRSKGSVIMLFAENYTLQSSTAYLNVFFPVDAGFSIPAKGLPASSSTVSISSINGNMDSLTLYNPCVGVCSFSAMYSTMFTQNLLNITLQVEFSGYIDKGTVMTLDLSGFALSSQGVAISIANNSAHYELSLISVKDNPLSINFTLPLNLMAFSPLSLYIQGLLYSLVKTSGPSLYILDSLLYPNNSVVIDFPAPSTVYEVPLIENVSLSISDLIAGGASVITFSFDTLARIENGTQIRVMLPLYSIDTSLSTPNTSFALILIDLSQSGVSFDIRFLTYLGIGSNWNILIYGIRIPYQGVSNMYPSFEASYAVSVAANIFSPFQRLIQPMVDAIYNITVTFISNSSRLLSSIRITFDVNFPVSVGDTITCFIPGLTSNQSFELIPDYLSLNASIIWTTNSSHLHILLLNSSYATSFTFQVYASNGYQELGIPARGFLGTTPGSCIFHRSALLKDIVASFFIPCYGICSAVCTVSIPKAGFPSGYTFTIIFGSRKFTSGDVLTLYLEGFSKNTSSIITTDLSSLSTTWDSLSSALNIVALNSFVDTFNLTFFISADQSIALPKTGIRVSNAFNLSWIARFGQIISNESILSFSSVGYAYFSNLEVVPRVAEAAASFNFTFNFLDDLYPGDIILLGLNGADVFFGPVVGFMANYNISAVGIPSTNTEYITIFHTSTLLLNVNDIILANSVILLYVPISAQVALPIEGFNAFNAPDFAIVSPLSPITTTNFQLFSLIGSLKPATLSMAGQIFYLTFKTQCELEKMAQLVLYFPSVSGQDQLIALSTNLGVTAISSGVYSSATSSIVLTFLQKVPLDTSISITLQASGLSLSNEIQYANSSSASYKVVSSLCGCDFTKFDASSAYLFVDSSISFSVPVAGENTNISVLLVPADDILTGDMFTFEFLYIGNSTGVGISDLFLFGSSALSFTMNSFVLKSNGTVQVNITAVMDLPASSIITVEFSSNSFFIPSDGIIAGSEFPLLWLRPSGLGTIVVAYGYFHLVEPISFFVSKSITITNPTPGQTTGIILSWQLSTSAQVGDIIIFELPGFTYGGSFPNAISVVGFIEQDISCSWNPSSFLFSIKFNR